MKKILLVVAILTMSQIQLFATAEHETKPYVGSAEFERLKSLAGTWKGTMTEMNGTNLETTVEYSVTSNGSVVVEKLFAGSPQEMISIYYDKNGKPSMTHYCGIGNQPQMNLISSSEKELKFDFSPASPVDAAKDAHMHSLTLSLNGNDKLVQTWEFFQAGSKSGQCTVTLARQ